MSLDRGDDPHSNKGIAPVSPTDKRGFRLFSNVQQTREDERDKAPRLSDGFKRIFVIEEPSPEKLLSNAFVPKEWPDKPVKLEGPGSKIIEISISILLGLITVCVLVYTILCASVHNTYPGRTIKYMHDGRVALPNLTSTFNQSANETHYIDAILNPDGNISVIASQPNNRNMKLLNLAKFGPTILPALFAAVIGISLRQLARWKAEIGSRLETLELLVGATSLFSTVSTVFSLRSFGPINIMLILLWCLSPLAGQASLRIIERRNIADVFYNATWSVEQTVGSSDWRVGVDDNLATLDLKSRYLACLANAYGNSQTISGLTGNNGYPLVPTSNIEVGWDQPHTTANLSSFAGIPVYGLSQPQGSNFSYVDLQDYQFDYLEVASNITIPAPLFEFNCLSYSQHNIANSSGLNNSSWKSALGPDSVYNDSLLDALAGSSSGFFLDTATRFNSSGSNDSLTINFGSFYNSKLTLRTCFTQVNWRSLTADCKSTPNTGLVCSFIDVGPGILSNFTPLGDISTALTIYKAWPSVDTATQNASSFTEIYIANGVIGNGDIGNGDIGNKNSLVDISLVDNITFSQRLTTMFNTFWILSKGDSTTKYISPTKAISATPVRVLPFTIIVCNWFYFSVLLFTSIILLLSAVMSVWISCQLVTPDILGYVSSMTVENPYVPILNTEPGFGSALNGLHRTRLLRTMRVQIKDVLPQRAIGKIAFSIQAVDGGTTRCNRKRVVK